MNKFTPYAGLSPDWHTHSAPVLHDAHVEAAFSHMLDNLPLAQWPAATLPAPPKVVRIPKGSRLLLALIARTKPVTWPFTTDFDYEALLDDLPF